MTDKSVASHIPKLIHQVFWKFTEKDLHEIPAFHRCTSETKEFCIEHGYEYKMWGLKECEELICDKYPHYINLWTEFRYPIQKCDFIRYLILYEYGGWYVDCDVFPIQDLSSLSKATDVSDHNEIFTTWDDDKKRLPYNAVMGSSVKNPLFLNIMITCERRTYEKQQMDIYNTWKARLVFQTTGHHMLNEVLAKANRKESIHNLMLIHNEKKKVYVTSPNPYFMDECVSLWYANGNIVSEQ